MIEDIEAGKINCVVTKDLSRLGRNYIMTGQYTELYFPSHNVRYIAIDDGVDSEKGESEIAPLRTSSMNGWLEIQAVKSNQPLRQSLRRGLITVLMLRWDIRNTLTSKENC